MDVTKFVAEKWDSEVVPTLQEYIKIPCQSPDFDAEWATNGLLESAMDLLVKWAKEQPVQGATFELLKDSGKTPFLYINIDAFDGQKPVPSTDANQAVVLMYGHMDKQPPLHGTWADGLGPYEPVIKDGKLYGRGGADDGYAIFASLLSVLAVQLQGKPHARTCIVIEASEESAESHLEHYITKLQPRFGNVTLVICLDSGALTWDRLWLTSSLRGVMSFQLKVELLREGIHSGVGGGAVADSFRIQRLLLERIEDSVTGEVKIAEAHCELPAGLRQQMSALNEIPRDEVLAQFPLLPGVAPEPGDNVELSLRTWWKPSFTVTGAAGLPTLENAGNVLRQQTTLNVSMRMPPLVKCKTVAAAIRKAVCTDVPYNAKVTVEIVDESDGWAAPPLAKWLEESLQQASEASFGGKSFAALGMGGSIPFMGMLGEMFPQAQFVITGVLGPQSNAHGPNEFLNIGYGKAVNQCVAMVLADHYRHSTK